MTYTQSTTTLTILSCPFREFNLANHHRSDPVTPPHFSGGQSLVPTITIGGQKVEEGTTFDPNFYQRRVHTQKFLLKPFPTLTANLRFLPFVKADQQRVKIFPARGGSGPKFVDHKRASTGQEQHSVASPRN
jgi:hypothetical protein